MKYFILIIPIFINTLFSKTFTVSDPPMVYIYHFVSYDTTEIIYNPNLNAKSEKVRLPLFNKNDLATGDNLVFGKAIDPKLVSAMVTSAVADNKHIQIAGESIQKRIKSDNFIKLVKSYDYPKRTDYIFLGEINTVANQYEIDLKLIDVSTQKISASRSFNLPFSNMTDLRIKIESSIKPLMTELTWPFLGYAYARVDSTSHDRVRWDDISIRPLSTIVGSNNIKNVDSDYSPFKSIEIPVDPWRKTHNKLLSKFKPTDVKMISDERNITTFLEGEYRFKIFLKDNEEPFITDFSIIAGNLNEIHISLPYIAPPSDKDGDGIIDENDACPEVPGEPNPDPKLNGCPPPELSGNIKLTNIWNGAGFEVMTFDENDDEVTILSGDKSNNKLNIDNDLDYEYRINNDQTSLTILELPLGIYVRNSFAKSEERFPGKHYVNLYSDTDTLDLDKALKTVNSKFSDRNKTTGREIVIYFNPFSSTKDEEYRLYLSESTVPFTTAKISGEMHIVGFPNDYEGSILVSRENYQNAEIVVKSGKSKLYKSADLTLKIEKEKEESGVAKLFGK